MDSMDWTIPQVLSEVAAIDPEPENLLVIALWNGHGNYDTKFWNVGMKTSEMIALLEITKVKLSRYMEETKNDD